MYLKIFIIFKRYTFTNFFNFIYFHIKKSAFMNKFLFKKYFMKNKNVFKRKKIYIELNLI
jgi:hypothetical protein